MKKYIIIGPAASGKDWLQKKFVEKGYKPLLLYTTRPIRPNEDGSEYNFVSEDYMDKITENKEYFISLKTFKGWRYGFTKDDFFNSDVCIITVSNLSDIKHKIKEQIDCEIIYLDIPEDVRRKRLNERYIGGNNDDTTERRIESDRNDFKGFEDYDIRLCTIEDINCYIDNINNKIS